MLTGAQVDPDTDFLPRALRPRKSLLQVGPRLIECEDTATTDAPFRRYDPYFVRSLTRFSDAGIIPPLSEAQREAIKLLEETCVRLKLHMVLDVGDIQWLSNEHVLHSRTEYKDHEPPSMSTLPFLDSRDSDAGVTVPHSN